MLALEHSEVKHVEERHTAGMRDFMSKVELLKLSFISIKWLYYILFQLS